MTDREKVIGSLEVRIISDTDAWYSTIEIPVNEAERILALLKEQEVKEGHWIVLEFCANEGIYCSECHMKIFDRTTKPKKKLSQYCPHCGSRNDQFFRDGEVVFR